MSTVNINLSRLNDLLGNDQQLVDKFLSIFVEEVPEDCNKLKDSIQRGNWNDVHMLAHGIKSQVRYLSMENTAKVAEKIEYLAETSPERRELMELAAHLSQEIDSAVKQI